MDSGANAWFRRRGPRLSGSLHIRDASGREVIVPLRGRDTLLTADGSGLPGYGAAWAVRTGPGPMGAGDSLMIVYGPTASVDDRCSGMCPAGRTVTLGGADFTWITGTGARVPAPRSTARNSSPTLRSAQRRATNIRASLDGGPGIGAGTGRRAETAAAPGINRADGLGHRLRNMVRIVTRAGVRR